MEFHLHATDAVDGERKSYGSIHLRKSTGERSDLVLDFFSVFQRLLPYAICLWLVSFLGLRWVAAPVAKVPLAPAPAPASTSNHMQCSAYHYPQCEAAIRWYLSAGASSRCAAFERVKAEGDLFQFPFSATSTAACTEPSCCGCPGQCSRCPPLLAECVSWRLDGSWRVALQDGVEVQYTFDAHGHCEIRQPAASLPKIWKRYSGAYVPTGNDVLVFEGTLQDAQARCKQYATCRSLVYSESGLSPEGVGQIFLKSVTDLVMVPGTAWVAWINDQHPNLVGDAAIAGPLVPVPGDELGRESFRIDLHRAAPTLFPEGSQDTLSIGADGGLVVHRRLGLAREPAHEQFAGTGILVHSA